MSLISQYADCMLSIDMLNVVMLSDAVPYKTFKKLYQGTGSKLACMPMQTIYFFVLIFLLSKS
jgi:hypothetical protein